mgnify:CR=1 FL=1
MTNKALTKCINSSSNIYETKPSWQKVYMFEQIVCWENMLSSPLLTFWTYYLKQMTSTWFRSEAHRVSIERVSRYSYLQVYQAPIGQMGNTWFIMKLGTSIWWKFQISISRWVCKLIQIVASNFKIFWLWDITLKGMTKCKGQIGVNSVFIVRAGRPWI